MTQDMHFNVELPTEVASAVIPLTLGCCSQFTVHQIAAANSDEGSFTLPVDFQAGPLCQPGLRHPLPDN